MKKACHRILNLTNVLSSFHGKEFRSTINRLKTSEIYINFENKLEKLVYKQANNEKNAIAKESIINISHFNSVDFRFTFRIYPCCVSYVIFHMGMRDLKFIAGSERF